MIGAIVLSLDAGGLHDMEIMAGELKVLPSRVLLMTQKAVEETADLLAEALTEEFRDHDRAGLGRDRISIEHRPMEAELAMQDGGWVEFPQRAHDIFAKNASALHWYDAAGGEHFAKVVHHPGWRGDDFVGRALRDVSTGLVWGKMASASFSQILTRNRVVSAHLGQSI